jgi:hypothetical protein
VEGGISSAGIAPPGADSETRVEDAVAVFCGVMASKARDSLRSSSRSKSNVKDMTAASARALAAKQTINYQLDAEREQITAANLVESIYKRKRRKNENGVHAGPCKGGCLTPQNVKCKLNPRTQGYVAQWLEHRT